MATATAGVQALELVTTTIMETNNLRAARCGGSLLINNCAMSIEDAPPSKRQRLAYPVESTVPTACTQEECCMGIDEAGRGPALGTSIVLSVDSTSYSMLGPMTYGTCYVPISQKKKLKKLGFDGVHRTCDLCIVTLFVKTPKHWLKRSVKPSLNPLKCVRRSMAWMLAGL